MGYPFVGRFTLLDWASFILGELEGIFIPKSLAKRQLFIVIGGGGLIKERGLYGPLLVEIFIELVIWDFGVLQRYGMLYYNN